MPMTPHAERYISYLREERLMRPRSLKDYITAVSYLCSEIDPLKASEYSQVNEAIKRLKSARSWAAATTSKNAKCIKNFYAWLTRERIIPHNPFPFHEFKRGRPETPEFITEKQYKTILADPLLTIQEVALIRLLWDCAPRISELCALDQKDINLEEMYIHVPREKSKGGYSDRVIPFTEDAARSLKKQVNVMRENGENQALFVNKWWARITPRDASEWLTRIGMRRSRCREALRLTPHMFRHSFGVRMIPLIGEVLTSKFLGHSSLSMTQYYVNMDRDSALEIYKKHVLMTA